jgi:hypothetical protein
LINTFYVAPEKAEELQAILERATDETMLQDPTARIPMHEAASVATSFDPVIYELHYSEAARASS